MSMHNAELVWERGDQDFLDRKYSRAHRWSFDGGAVVAGSSAPEAIRPPLSDPAAVDPEEAFVAALASCHLLWFLALAAKAGFRVDRYQDLPQGELARDERGRMAVTRVTLRPRVQFSGALQPTSAQLEQLHHEAHEACYIANSVRSQVHIESRSED
jgi:organic hydroperoxide reductase OsmC/OhrA